MSAVAEKKQTYAEVVAKRDAYKAGNDALKRDRVNRQAKDSVFLNQSFLDDDSDPDDFRPWAL